MLFGLNSVIILQIAQYLGIRMTQKKLCFHGNMEIKYAFESFCSITRLKFGTRNEATFFEMCMVGLRC